MQVQKTFMQVRLKTFMHVRKTFKQVRLKTLMQVQKTLILSICFPMTRMYEHA